MMDDQSDPAAPTNADEILAYLAGDLSAGEDEELQQRLSRDPEGTRLLLDLADPTRLVDTGEKGWATLRKALRDEGVFRPAPRPVLAKLRTYYPLAAVAALLVASLGLALVLGRQNGEAPDNDIAIVELLPESASGPRDGDAAIRATPDFAYDFILYSEDIAPDSAYQLIIDGPRGAESLRRSLRTNMPGRIVLRLKATDLEAGLYAARLVDEDSPATPIATYRIHWKRP